jgi:hypothetical protein
MTTEPKPLHKVEIPDWMWDLACEMKRPDSTPEEFLLELLREYRRHVEESPPKKVEMRLSIPEKYVSDVMAVIRDQRGCEVLDIKPV